MVGWRRRLRRAAFKLKNHDDTAGEDSGDHLPPPEPSPELSTPPVQGHETSPSGSPAGQIRQDNRNEQLESALFSRLPLEIRRMIYTRVWLGLNETMKMHIHASSKGPKLAHTRCKCSTEESGREETDPMQLADWPGWRGKNQPPKWFWHAWGLRLRWGAHWKCQADAMLAWKPAEYESSDDLGGLWSSDFLYVFLTCKRM